MPTGYTADLYDGNEVSFSDFVMHCARAFGALVTMRDSPSDAEVPDEFTPSDYHRTELDRARVRLAEVEAWTPEDAHRAAADSHAEALGAWMEAQQRRRDVRGRYEAMLEQVQAWTPPTDEHQDLKDFMVQQLTESIRFDTEYTWPQPAEVPAGRFKRKQQTQALKDINYHTEQYAKDVERAHSRTAWVRDLRDSLGVRQ